MAPLSAVLKYVLFSQMNLSISLNLNIFLEMFCWTKAEKKDVIKVMHIIS